MLCSLLELELELELPPLLLVGILAPVPELADALDACEATVDIERELSFFFNPLTLVGLTVEATVVDS